MLERGTRESEQRHGIPTVFVISSPKVNGCLRGGFWYSNETGFVIIRSKVGTMVNKVAKDEHDGFWCIIIECLSIPNFHFELKTILEDNFKKLSPITSRHYYTTFLNGSTVSRNDINRENFRRRRGNYDKSGFSISLSLSLAFLPQLLSHFKIFPSLKRLWKTRRVPATRNNITLSSRKITLNLNLSRRS